MPWSSGIVLSGSYGPGISPAAQMAAELPCEHDVVPDERLEDVRAVVGFVEDCTREEALDRLSEEHVGDKRYLFFIETDEVIGQEKAYLAIRGESESSEASAYLIEPPSDESARWTLYFGQTQINAATFTGLLDSLRAYEIIGEPLNETTATIGTGDFLMFPIDDLA